LTELDIADSKPGQMQSRAGDGDVIVDKNEQIIEGKDEVRQTERRDR